jgi:hypothetical protein
MSTSITPDKTRIIHLDQQQVVADRARILANQIKQSHFSMMQIAACTLQLMPTWS